MTRYEQNLAFRLRSVGRRAFLIRANRAIEVNEVGEEIWRRLGEAASQDEIVAQLKATYDAPVDELEKDVTEFLEILLTNGAIETSSA